MAFINEHGEKIGCDCSDLIDDLLIDIAKFDETEEVNVLCRETQGVVLCVDYKFGDGKDFVTEYNEFVKRMTMGELLNYLEKQDASI